MVVDTELDDALDQVAEEGADSTKTVEGTEDTSTETQEEGTEETTEETPSSFREKYAELTGRDTSAFKTDEALMASLGNLQVKISERDEDAKLGQVFKGHEDEIVAFLATQKKKTGVETVGPEYNELWRQQIMADPENAPADVVQKLRAFLAFRDPYLDGLARNPKAVLGEVVRELVKEETGTTREKLRGEAETRFTEERVNTELAAFDKAQADWMYVNGDSELGPTELGKEMLSTFQQLNPAAFQSATARAERAMAIVKGSRPPAKQSRKVPDSAKRQVSNAAPSGQKTFDELKEAGKPLDEIIDILVPEG